MAESLLLGSAVGAVFGELLKAVLDMKSKVTLFKPTLRYLQTTLLAIAPVISEIEQHNNDLGRPKEELESLIKEMEQGKELVYKCSKIGELNLLARISYQEQLAEFIESLMRFFIINMQAQISRDQKETLFKVRRLYSAANKKHSFRKTSYIEEANVSVDAEASESKSTQLDTEEAETSSVEQVMENITSLSQNVSQIDANAEHSQSIEQGKIIAFEGCPDFDHGDLVSASPEELVMTVYGTSHKVKLQSGTKLVVKKLIAKELKLLFVELKMTEFVEKVKKILQRISHHPNVVPLLACINTIHEKWLIYDVIVGNSLSTLLHGTIEDATAKDLYSRMKFLLGLAGTTRAGKRNMLYWNSRMKILLGVAKGIAHIHSVMGGGFFHGNITPSNVLVTIDLQGLISDFALSSFLNGSLVFSESGYQAPEVIKTRKMTQKSDVYSFGLILLEMLTGKSVLDCDSLLEWIKLQAIHGLLPEELDQAIRGNEYGIEMLQLAMECVEFVPDKRPSMDKVVKEMEYITKASKSSSKFTLNYL